MNAIDRAKASWARVKSASSRGDAFDPEYIRALVLLADLVPDLIRLAEEPKATYLRSDTNLCTNTPYVCTMSKGHNVIPDWGPDPEARHGNDEIQWWRENGRLVFGWGR